MPELCSVHLGRRGENNSEGCTSAVLYLTSCYRQCSFLPVLETSGTILSLLNLDYSYTWSELFMAGLPATEGGKRWKKLLSLPGVHSDLSLGYLC